MEFKSQYFAAYMSTRVEDIPSDPLKAMLMELIANASWIMDTTLEGSAVVKMTETIVSVLRDPKHGYNHFPFHLVCDAFGKGQIGELGGTSKFSLRNVFTWCSACKDSNQRLTAESISKREAARRMENERIFRVNQRHNSMYGTALVMKLGWWQSGALKPEAWENCTLDAIVSLLKQGHKEYEITPKMIIDGKN